ncbi:hypothetical protein KC318_g15660 [Hortaea werneckii]|uniref:Transglycosylase SLT domain-containing protein n=1 Tax=Hortaea werneckii TaxID=91943 RepID=A0A3M6YUU7_HORWE|nr:hypothetical protein KC334_g15801 [Hortaea werneckii]KAI6938777.1 hypothetical protein KC355_g15724 [Hortaea werneckii]KAI7651487.1 hypothetical protein KC318_g15660 [Hortaea werneckii]RMY06773.1 hypothetical protein D0867_09579 [Hortaea werneckii]RMY14511.1 hypothetical protein D0866_13925 [Hortaea werneckii]
MVATYLPLFALTARAFPLRPWEEANRGISPYGGTDDFLDPESSRDSSTGYDDGQWHPSQSWNASADESSTEPWSASSSPAATPAIASVTSGYNMYTGDGSTQDGWPSEPDFKSFDELWDANEPVMSTSCSLFDQANDSPDEINDLKSAIEHVSQSAHVDPRFALAIMMQESKGCVRVWSTSHSHTNPGLFQSHKGRGSCNTGTDLSASGVQNPCPASEIRQMVSDGVEGTDSGDGLKQLLEDEGGNFFKAARRYNSGSIDPSGDLSEGVATHCYASDVANRLIGTLTGEVSACTLDD